MFLEQNFFHIKKLFFLICVLLSFLLLSACQNNPLEKMENIHPVDSFFVQFDDPFEWAKARISENGNYIRVPLPNTDLVVNYQ